jgi:hypothetical protein
MSKAVTVAWVLAAASAVWAGPTEHIGREVTKGVSQEVKKELKEQAPKVDLHKGARDVGNGLLDSVADHGKAINRGARDVGRDIAQGFFMELRTQLGPDGKGPLATSLANAGQNGTQQLLHGIGTELAHYLPACKGSDRAACIDAVVQRYSYEFSKSAARGAADGAPPWTTLIFAGLGFAAGLLVSAILALLIGQRRTRRELATLRPRTA